MRLIVRSRISLRSIRATIMGRSTSLFDKARAPMRPRERDRVASAPTSRGGKVGARCSLGAFFLWFNFSPGENR